MDIWNLFVTNKILGKIVEYTNKYIKLKQYNVVYKTATPTDIIDIKALIGLCMYIWCNKKQS